MARTILSDHLRQFLAKPPANARRAGLLICLLFIPGIATAQDFTPGGFRTDQILIRPRPEITPSALAGFHALRGGEVARTFARFGNLQLVRLPKGETVPEAIARYQQSGLVEFAEPDHIIHAALTPNDPRFLDGSLWGLHNTGQAGGIPDADIDAPEGWDVFNSASNIVVAVLDSGILFTHEDLATNLWTNPTDGGHGFNAFTGLNNASDDSGHGTLVAGVLGGAGNNGKGIAGVAWRVQMMSCKCLDSGNNGSDSTLIASIEYALTNGAHIINASLDSPSYSSAVSNAIYSTRAAGILFVASAGNNNANVDVSPRYPSCYQIDNIVSVAASTRLDTLWNLSNYGATNVDLAAPGDQIYSTFFLNNSFYLGPLGGTSLAAPYVTGTLALMLAKYPGETHQQIIARLLNATDPVAAFAGKCVTGGRLNLRNALSPPIKLTALPAGGGTPFQLQLSGGPNRVCVLHVSTNLVHWAPVFTNTTSGGGTFIFTDAPSTNSPQRFYRATSTL